MALMASIRTRPNGAQGRLGEPGSQEFSPAIRGEQIEERSSRQELGRRNKVLIRLINNRLFFRLSLDGWRELLAEFCVAVQEAGGFNEEDLCVCFFPWGCAGLHCGAGKRCVVLPG